MSERGRLLAEAEERARADTGIIWDGHGGSWRARPGNARRHGGPPASPAPPATTTAGPPAPACEQTQGACYAHDGSLEGILTAVHRCFLAHDAAADLVAEHDLQPRLGQRVVHVEACLESALKTRRALEYSQGEVAFHCVRAASASDDPGKGTAIYRFIRHALACSPRRECLACPRKGTCTQACAMPASCALVDDLGSKPVFDLMVLYRAVMNERHKMEQFMRFEHCEGDVWYARCNPNASVVPLLMDWFVTRFNDQRFVIHDENHGVSGVYDGRRWHLVRGDAVTPPARTSDEAAMRMAWRRFYERASVEARYHPELRRAFMPMRLWRNLPELERR